MGDRSRAAPGPRHRVGEQRPAGLPRELGGCRTEPIPALVAAGDHHAASCAGDERAQPLGRLAALARRGREGDVWASRGPGRRVLRQLDLCDQRLTQREVQVHGAGPPPQGGPVGAARERADPAELLLARVVHRHLEEPLGSAAEQLQLVDRLAGAVFAQLRGAVGGEHEQRHAGLAGLDHGGGELGSRRTRGARHRHGQTCGLRHPEGEEARAALVDVRVAMQASLAGERQHQRRGSRPRGGTGRAHPAARQLLHEGPEERVGVGGAGHRMVWCRRASSCFTASAAPVAPGIA